MIKDSLKNHKHFLKIRADFEQAFEFLSRKDLENIPDGKYAIDGPRVYVIISHTRGRGVKNAKLEAHRKYIDIQYIVSGRELIGISKTVECKYNTEKYSPEKDIIYFADKPGKYIKLRPGDFAVFFPEDAHAPLSGKNAVHKAVVKVQVL